MRGGAELAREHDSGEGVDPPRWAAGLWRPPTTTKQVKRHGLATPEHDATSKASVTAAATVVTASSTAAPADWARTANVMRTTGSPPAARPVRPKPRVCSSTAAAKTYDLSTPLTPTAFAGASPGRSPLRATPARSTADRNRVIADSHTTSLVNSTEDGPILSERSADRPARRFDPLPRSPIVGAVGNAVSGSVARASPQRYGRKGCSARLRPVLAGVGPTAAIATPALEAVRGVHQASEERAVDGAIRPVRSAARPGSRPPPAAVRPDRATENPPMLLRLGPH